MFWKQKKQILESSTLTRDASIDGTVKAANQQRIANSDPSMLRQDSQTAVDVADDLEREDYVVPKGYTLRGNPCCSGRIVISGVVEGVVRATDVRVESTGHLDGSSVARVISVAGGAKSNLVATERLTLLPGAQVSGRLQTPVIEISPQAQIVNAEMKIG